jgi:hypothetical protein
MSESGHGGRPMTLGEIARGEDNTKSPEQELPPLTEREVIWQGYFELRCAVESLAAAASAGTPELAREYRGMQESALGWAREFRNRLEREAHHRERHLAAAAGHNTAARAWAEAERAVHRKKKLHEMAEAIRLCAKLTEERYGIEEGATVDLARAAADQIEGLRPEQAP